MCFMCLLLVPSHSTNNKEVFLLLLFMLQVTCSKCAGNFHAKCTPAAKLKSVYAFCAPAESDTYYVGYVAHLVSIIVIVLFSPQVVHLDLGGKCLIGKDVQLYRAHFHYAFCAHIESDTYYVGYVAHLVSLI